MVNICYIPSERAPNMLPSLDICNYLFRCQIPWPIFSRELCRKAHIAGANLKGGSEDFRRNDGQSQKIGR